MPAWYAADRYSVDDILFWLAIAQNPLLPAVILLQSNEETDVDGWSPFYSSSVGQPFRP